MVEKKLMKETSDSDFVFGLTLTEIVILFLFILLLLTAHGIQENKRASKVELESVRTELESVKTELESAKPLADAARRNQLTPEDLDKRFEMLRRYKDRITQLEEQNKELTSELSSKSELGRQLKEADQNIESLRGELDRTREEAQNTRAQLANMGRRGGIDHPPCWASGERGNIDYLYAITLVPGIFNVEHIWPEHRKNEAAAIPGAMDIQGESAETQFQTSAGEVLSWSKAQVPECRHFVKIYDCTAVTDKVTYKNMLHTVESYFYKSLRDCNDPL